MSLNKETKPFSTNITVMSMKVFNEEACGLMMKEHYFSMLLHSYVTLSTFEHGFIY